MRDALINMKPNKFDDIIALVALYRPGPMSNIPTYNQCKHGEKQPDYLHPKLEKILQTNIRCNNLSGAGYANSSNSFWFYCW